MQTTNTAQAAQQGDQPVSLVAMLEGIKRTADERAFASTNFQLNAISDLLATAIERAKAERINTMINRSATDASGLLAALKAVCHEAEHMNGLRMDRLRPLAIQVQNAQQAIAAYEAGKPAADPFRALVEQLARFTQPLYIDHQAELDDFYLMVEKAKKLVGDLSPETDGSDEPDGSCTNPGGHKFECTGTQYGGDDDRWHGEGRCLCIYCGADGDG